MWDIRLHKSEMFDSSQSLNLNNSFYYNEDDDSDVFTNEMIRKEIEGDLNLNIYISFDVIGGRIVLS